VSTLVLSEHFLPDQGGTITWLMQTYSRYDPKEVVFVVGQHSHAQLVDPELPFQVQRIPMKVADWDPSRPASLWQYVGMVRRVYKVCRHYKVRQIHCMKVFSEGLVAWWIQQISSIPYLLYAHGEEILFARTSRKLSWLMPKIYQHAGAIIANSHHTKKILLEEVGIRPEKIHVIHPGVNVNDFRVTDEMISSVRQRHKLESSPVLLTVGRLQRRKGQDMVIKALPLITKRFPNVKYVIVGAGEEQTALRKLTHDLGVKEQVIFVGQVPESELAAYFAACDVFIMPNRQIGPDIEGFGMVFLEAGAAGKPVIGGKSGGTGEAIAEGVTGIRVNGSCVEEIATAVIALLMDPTQAQLMGECGRRRVETEFSWSSIVSRTREVASSLA
jgi:phosphatidylinositol alpha-1,6-mannosyltransferase